MKIGDVIEAEVMYAAGGGDGEVDIGIVRKYKGGGLYIYTGKDCDGKDIGKLFVPQTAKVMVERKRKQKMDTKKECEKLEIERLKKQNQQIDIEIEYRKVELELLKKALKDKT